MAQEVDLKYTVEVDDDTLYSLKVRIVEGQPGSFVVAYATCPYATGPINNRQEWITVLATGREIRGKKILWSSATKNANGLTNRVTVKVFINDKEIKPESHGNNTTPNTKQVDSGVEVVFNQEIIFS